MFNKAGLPAYVAGLLAVHAVMIGVIACQSPTMDEAAHLAAGVRIWHTGRCDLYRVNPPLVRAIAALPAVVIGASPSWDSEQIDAAARPEFSIGIDFVRRNGLQESVAFTTLARIFCIPFSLLGGYICWRWAKELYGRYAGLVALLLWCFSPNVLACSSTICPDAAAAALGVTSAYFYWRWLRAPSWPGAVAAGLALGVAELTKMTWVIAFGVWPFLWLLWEWSDSHNTGVARRGWQGTRRRLGQLAAILALGLYVLNLGYGFRETFRPLAEYEFGSRILAGKDSVADGAHGGNRFRHSKLGLIPVPVPKDYLSGVDAQRLDFECGRSSYLLGEWKEAGGWWYYYCVCLIFKVPVGTWVLGMLAVAVTASCFGPQSSGSLSGGISRRPHRDEWLNEITLLLPAMAVFILVSSQTGFSRYLRYAVPAFPFVFIWIGKVGPSLLLQRKLSALVVCMAMTWSISSCLWAFPHTLSYFNEIAGGPKKGHYYLADANIDWGQDMGRLKNWHEDHSDARPLRVRVNTLLSPSLFGIDYIPLGTVAGKIAYDAQSASEFGPCPGWYAVSAHYLHDPAHDYLLQFEPVATAGYSIYIYHITLEDANRARREMGLPELPQEFARHPKGPGQRG